MNIRLVVLATLIGAIFGQKTTQECEDAQYYGSVNLNENDPTTLLNNLKALISGHTVYEYTDSPATDVWDMIKDLDADPNDNTKVQLIYSDDTVNNDEGSGIWNREHIWPRSFGVSNSGADTSDIHNLRGAYVNVNSQRGNQYFDECPGCTSPAHPQASATSASDNVKYQPPVKDRGIVARAVFYMAVRYDGVSDSLTEELVLGGSCIPSPSEFRMGNLTTLLRWHEENPPTAAEKERNMGICTKYQGNKNPFVDHPELAAKIFSQLDSCSGVSPSPNPVQEPTPPPARVDEWKGGDLAVIGYNGADATNPVVILAHRDLQPGETFYISDSGVDATGVIGTNEGTYKYTVPAGGIPRGTTIYFDTNALVSDGWEKIGGSFALSKNGDSIILYAKNNLGDIQYITGLIYKASWGSGTSQEPPGLPEYAKLTLSNHNGYYNGVKRIALNTLKGYVGDSSLWTVSAAPVDLTLVLDSIDGFIPSQAPTPRPEGAEDKGYGNGLRTFCVLLFWVNLSIALSFAFWTFVNRDHSIVRVSQYLFLGMITLGALISSCTILLLIVDDQDDEEGLAYTGEYTKANVLCAMTPWFYVTGFTITFTPLFAKLWRVHRIFNNKRLRRINISNSQLLKSIAAVVAFDWTVVLVWSIVDPLVYRREILEVDDLGLPTLSVGRCQCDNALPFVAVIICFHLAIVAFGVRLCYLTRKISTSFQEGKYVSIAMISNLQVLALGVPVLIVFNDDPQTFVFIACFMLFLNDLSIQLVIFLPKIYAWVTNQQITASSATKGVDGVDDKTDTSGLSFDSHSKISSTQYNPYLDEALTAYSVDSNTQHTL